MAAEPSGCSGPAGASELPAAALLEALGEAALILDTRGRILAANRAARARFDIATVGGDLTEFAGDPEAAAALLGYLWRCAGSGAAQPGACTLRTAEGGIALLRCRAAALPPPRPGAPARILLRFDDAAAERFAPLTRKVDELNDEIRRRRRTQAELEEALRERDLLMRELHHRVKNNIQMLVSMLAVARREAAGRDAGAVLEEASRRLAAVGAVHQVLHAEGSLEGISGEIFIDRIAHLVLQASGSSARLVLDAGRMEIPNEAAVPLALIVNELLTNAFKYGRREDNGEVTVHVGLTALPDGTLELAVEDEGPGFPAATAAGPRRASGLGLVRGLTRQVGGAFRVEKARSGGARCVLRFGRRHESGASAREMPDP